MKRDDSIAAVLGVALEPHTAHVISVAYEFAGSPKGARNWSNLGDLPVTTVLDVLRKRYNSLALLHGHNYERVTLRLTIEMVEGHLVNFQMGEVA